MIYMHRYIPFGRWTPRKMPELALHLLNLLVADRKGSWRGRRRREGRTEGMMLMGPELVAVAGLLRGYELGIRVLLHEEFNVRRSVTHNRKAFFASVRKFAGGMESA